MSDDEYRAYLDTLQDCVNDAMRLQLKIMWMVLDKAEMSEINALMRELDAKIKWLDASQETRRLRNGS